MFQRWNYHKHELRQGRHDNPKLQNAWNKYGSDVWVRETLKLCSPEDLLKEEQVFIDKLQAVKVGYNIAPKADRPPSPLGKKCSEEHCRHVAEAKLGKPLSDEHKAAMRRGWEKRRARGLGLHTAETKRRMSEVRKGRPKTQAHKEHLSLAWTQRPKKTFD